MSKEFIPLNKKRVITARVDGDLLDQLDKISTRRGEKIWHIERALSDYINTINKKSKKASTAVAKVKTDTKPPLFNRVIAYIEECTGRKFKESSELLARISEGYTFEQFSQMINYKAKEWMGTDMQKYLRPSTLFNKTKFEGYLSDAEQGVLTHEEYQRDNISDKDRDRAEVRRQLADPEYALANF